MVKGIYIPKKDSGYNFTVGVSGEALQDCQQIVTSSNAIIDYEPPYSHSNRYFIPKGKVDAKDIRIDSYGKENIIVVIRAIESDENPIGNLKVTVR